MGTPGWEPVWYTKFSRIPGVYRPIASLRCRSHRLNIECMDWSGRDKNKSDYHVRFFDSCPNRIEEEYHFLVECLRYAQLTGRLLPSGFTSGVPMVKIIKY